MQAAPAARLILLLIERIESTLARYPGQAFLDDEDAQDAVAHRLLHIGEAVRSLAPASRAVASEVAWERAIAMRHRLAHNYLGTDPSILWDTAINSLPPLAAACRAIIAESQS